ncbi:hypothetical protein RBI13_09260 [Alcaligenaceae bacterium A4P071]|nr:hypothetical protein [Alcaligenaceae bacterium A4P071]
MTNDYDWQEMRELCDTSTEALRRLDAFVSAHPKLTLRADEMEYDTLKGAALHSARRQAAFCKRYMRSPVVSQHTHA